MFNLLATFALIICTSLSFADEELSSHCFDKYSISFLGLFDSLSQNKLEDKKLMLICESETGNPFATILLAENYAIFNISTSQLYPLVRKHAEEGEDRSLAILGLSYIDPRLKILANGSKPNLMRWYSGDANNYEEAGKFYHQYYFGDENRASSYKIVKAYVYLVYAKEFGNNIAGMYINKLMPKMDKRELQLANKIIENGELLKTM